MKSFFACIMLCFALGCHGQLPPTNSVVTLNATPPQPAGTWLGCVIGQPVCTFVFSRALVTGGSCPATGTAYAPLNATAPSTNSAYTDTTVSGLTACYTAQILQSGGVSLASNTVGPFVVPASPLAPALTGQTTTASLAKPAPPAAKQLDVRPVLAYMSAPGLEARIVTVRR